MKPEVKVTVLSEFNEVGSSTSSELFCVAKMITPKFEESERAPLDVVVVLDRSGSMGGEKLELAKEALEYMVEQLKATDRMGLVTFDHNMQTVYKSTFMSSDKKELVLRKIKDIHSGGSTNLSGGLLSGMDVLEQGRSSQKKEEEEEEERKERVESVLLFTDGEANAGIKDKDGLVSIVNDFFVRKDGVNNKSSVHGFGFGKSHNEGVIRAIAEAGKGSYYYIESADDMPVAFGDCLGGLMSVAAQNAKLTIKGLNDVTIQKVYGTTYKVEKEGDDTAVIVMGDLFSEERKDIAFDLLIPAGETAEVCQVELDYYACQVSQSMQSKANLLVDRGNTTRSPDAESNAEVEEQRARLLTSEALDKARKQAKSGSIKEAQSTLSTTMASLEKIQSRQPKKSILIEECLEDMKECAADSTTQERFNSRGAKKFAMFGHSHGRQRACVSSAAHVAPGRRCYDSADHYMSKVRAKQFVEEKKAAKLAAKSAQMAAPAAPRSAGVPPVSCRGPPSRGSRGSAARMPVLAQKKKQDFDSADYAMKPTPTPQLEEC